MPRLTLIAATALAGLGLAACQDNARGAANGVCKPFTAPASAAAPANNNSATTAVPNGAAVLPPAPTDPAGQLDDCLHRWGYTLAASTDAANIVAQATLAACASQLAGWNQESLSNPQGGGGARGGSVEAPSLMNGETTNPLAEHYNFAAGRALFYVV